MENRFFHGQSLKGLWFSDDACYRVGTNDVTSIDVVFENGQCDGVPWAIVRKGDDTIKVNLASVQEVLV